MPHPRVSIILPTHNRADVLAFAIRSCLAQTLADFELLVVGDGCTDATAELVRAFNDPRVHWFDRPKAPGFGYEHRNFALREAKGEFIAWQAHDDLWLPDHLERMVGLFKNDDVVWTHSRPTWVTSEGLICPAAFFLDDPDTRQLFVAMEDSLLHANCVVHRRNCVDRFGVWNPELASCGDWDYWARIIRAGVAIAVLPEITTLHFRAIWRTGLNFAGALQPLLDWHSRGGPERDGLRLKIPDGLAEQEAAWQEIVRDGGEWPIRLREAALRLDRSRLALEEKQSRLAGKRELTISEAVAPTSLRARYWRMRWRWLQTVQRLKDGL